jgi:hypothetical protein
MQSNEIALRMELLGSTGQSPPPNSAVFDFSAVEKISKELQASGWKPTP